MTNHLHTNPDEDVVISSAYRGDIRCRKLVVTKTGSVVGNVEAYDVRNYGRIQGIVNAADTFINNEGAKVRGRVFAPYLGTHPKSGIEADTSNTHRFDSELSPAPFSPSMIDNAVSEGIRRELGKQGLGVSNVQHSGGERPFGSRTADSLVEQSTETDETEEPRFKWGPPGVSRAFYLDENGNDVTIRGYSDETAERAEVPAPVDGGSAKYSTLVAAREATRRLPPLFAELK